MTREELLGRRWAAQGLKPSSPRSPQDTVAALGAVQAQDRPSALIAIALRGQGTAPDVQSALDQGQLVRTHVMRPTWHIVASSDLRWMMELTGPRVNQSGAGRYRQLGLPTEVRTVSRRVIEKALAKGPLGKDELRLALAGAGIPTEGQALVHCLMDAELELVICNGPRRAKESTYDLVDRRIPATPKVSADEARARLALRYASGHGPVTDRDFSWWSGLPLTEARRGLEACGGALTVGTWNDARVWFDPREPVATSPFLWLPAFDEYVIAYTDRTAVLSPDENPRAVSSNGIFWPVVLVQGVVAGTWSAPVKKGARPVAVDWFTGEPAGGELARLAWETKLGELTQ